MKSTKKALAIDIGGTKICHCLIDEMGEITTAIEKLATPKTAEEIFETLKNIAKKYKEDFDILAIATAGAVNNENTSVISSTANLANGYHKIDFSKLTEKKVFVENDANCAAWAEFKLGSAKGHLHTIVLTLGTGVGSGIIVNGHLLKGKNGAAGEMHFKMSLDKKRKCTCGSYDCFEAYGSGSALTLDAREMTGGNATSHDIIKGVKNNDSECIEIFERWQNDICDGLIGLANIFDPESIVLSGSMAEFVDCEKLTRNVNDQIVTTPTKILHAKFKNNSGMIGAALLAFDA